jgi:hypothetical protein
VDPIGGLERVEARRFGSDADDLVALVGRACRIAVPEDGGVHRVAADLFEDLGCEDDVVGLRSAEVEEAEVGPSPVEAVVALGVAEDAGMIGEGLSRRAAEAVVEAVIVQAEEAVVLEDGFIGAGVALPGSVGTEDDLAADGMVQLEAGAAGHALEEEVIHEEFKARAKVHWFPR